MNSVIQYKAGRRRRLPRVFRGSMTKEEWLKIIDFYGHKCLCCGRTDEKIKLTKDHIRPLMRGGTDYAHNIQPLCGNCNRLKGARWIDYRPDLGHDLFGYDPLLFEEEEPERV